MSDRSDPHRAVESGDGSHHPGPPRFVTVGERIGNPNGHEMETRDDLAPWNPDPTGEYEWAVIDAPDGSTAKPTDEPIAEFEPDVPGVYTLKLDAPDGRHELTVRAFPADADDAPRPQLSLDARVVDDRVELVASTAIADEATAPEAETAIDVEYYVDDRDGVELSSGGTIPIEEITESARIYGVAVGDRHSVPDAIELVAVEAEEGDANEPIRIEHPFEPPEWVEDAIIYELFTRRFPDQDEPTFETIADRLDHLDRLGVDVVWLTPFLDAESGFGTPMDRGGPHGYDTIDYFRVDPALGTMADFEALVDACHDRDIRVVFDLVINHTAATHPFYEAAIEETHPLHDRYRDWYRWETFEDREADTYFGWEGLPNLDHSSLGVRAYLLAVVDFWAERVDGMRADVAWGVPLSFWTEVHDRVTSADSEFFLLDETLPSDVEMGGGRFHVHHDDVLHGVLKRLGETVRERPPDGATIAAGADTAGNGTEDADTDVAVADAFATGVDRVETTTADAILDAVEERARRGSHPDSEWLLYIENHDTDRYLAEYGRDPQRAAAAATVTLPGSPLLYYGQETGLTGRRAPMNWATFDEDLLSYYERLLECRRTEPALRTAATLDRISYETDTDMAVAFARSAPEDDRRVVVAIQFGEGTASVTVAEPIDGTDLLTGETVVDPETGAIVVDSVVVLEAASGIAG